MWVCSNHKYQVCIPSITQYSSVYYILYMYRWHRSLVHTCHTMLIPSHTHVHLNFLLPFGCEMRCIGCVYTVYTLVPIQEEEKKNPLSLTLSSSLYLTPSLLHTPTPTHKLTIPPFTLGRVSMTYSLMIVHAVGHNGHYCNET